MDRNIILEDINRIKQIMNIGESSSSSEVIEEQLAKLFSTLEKNLIASTEKELGKKLARATDQEIQTILGKAEMSTVRAALAKNLYQTQKRKINGVLNKYNLSTISGSKKAAAELENVGLNPELTRDVMSEYGAAKASVVKTKTNVSTSTSGKPAAPKPAAPKTAAPKLNIPDIERTVTANVFSETELLNKLKLSFPGAKSSDLAKMVANFKNANFKTQKSFDNAYRDAINAYDPIYQEYLLKPGVFERMKGEYDKLGKYGKRMFWAIAIPGGYKLIKHIGIPVQGLTGWVWDTWKEMGKDQVKGITKKNSDDNASSDSSENNEAKYQNNIDGFKTYASDNGVNATNAISLPGGIYKTKNDAIVDYKFVEKDSTTKLGTFEAE